MYDTFRDYNRLNQLPNLSINIINCLLDNNETIWKLLKYETNDALDKPNLTSDEKTNLIYDGSGEEENYRVFTKGISSNAQENNCTQLRVFVWKVTPVDHIKSRVDMAIQIISHTSILTLNNYQNRNELLFQQLVATLNGAYINGVSQLVFDKKSNSNNAAMWNAPTEKWYESFDILMSCMVSTVNSDAGE